MINVQKIIYTCFLTLISMASAQAALVNYTITGDVLLGDELGDYNAFELTLGDTITASGVFDDSALSAGSGTILFGSGSINTMTLYIGTEIFTADNDGSPTMTLSNFSLTDFDYYALAGVNGAPADFSSFFTGFDDGAFLYGEWQTTVTLTPVPVPAAVWLFGSGLIGLIGIARRRQSV